MAGRLRGDVARQLSWNTQPTLWEVGGQCGGQGPVLRVNTRDGAVGRGRRCPRSYYVVGVRVVLVE